MEICIFNLYPPVVNTCLTRIAMLNMAVLLMLTPGKPAWAQDVGEDRVYSSKSREAERLYNEAMGQMDQEQFTAALDLLNQCLFYQPDNVEAYLQRALAREHLQDPKGALTDYEIVLYLDSTYKEAAFNRAKLRFKQEQYPQALKEFKQVLNMSSGETRAVYFKGTLLNSQGQPAMNAITTGFNLDGDIWNYIGLIHHQLKRYDSAVTAYSQAIAINPHEANYLVNRGLSRIELRRTQEAISDFQKALSLAPDHPIAEFNLTQELEKSGTLDLHAYDQIIEGNPEFASPYVNRALAKLQAGDLKGAIADYDLAIAKDPYDAQIFLNRGLAYEKGSDLHNALKDYNQALRLDPELTAVYRSRGRVLFALERYQLALEDFGEALKINSQDAAAYFNRALVYRRLGRNEDCCQDLRQAQVLDLEIASKALDSYCNPTNN